MKRRLVELMLALSFILGACASSVLPVATPAPTLEEQLQALLPDYWTVIEVAQWSEQLVVVVDYAALDSDDGAQLYAVDGLLAILQFSLQYFEETTPDDPEIGMAVVGFAEPIDAELCESGWTMYGMFVFDEDSVRGFLELAGAQREIWIGSKMTWSHDIHRHAYVMPLTSCYAAIQHYDPPVQEYP